MLSKVFVNPILDAIENRLDLFLAQNTQSDLLMEAMRYSSLNGGKRIRPLLTIATGKLNNADFNTLLSVAVAIELIHCYSLIHDDLPAMDNDDLRRGRPTCHKKYNEAIAILAGDALQSQAFAILSDDNLNLPLRTKMKIIQIVSHNAGVNGMVGGQAIDLASTGASIPLEELQQMHLKKTGALIKAAILSGYLVGNDYNKSTYQALSNIADNLGLLFQITDDILDLTTDTSVLGKTANKDLDKNKATYVNLLGIDKSRELTLDLYQDTLTILGNIPKSEELSKLTNFIYTRSS